MQPGISHSSLPLLLPLSPCDPFRVLEKQSACADQRVSCRAFPEAQGTRAADYISVTYVTPRGLLSPDPAVPRDASERCLSQSCVLFTKDKGQRRAGSGLNMAACFRVLQSLLSSDPPTLSSPPQAPLTEKTVEWFPTTITSG